MVKLMATKTDEQRVQEFLLEWSRRPLDLSFLEPKLPEGYDSWEDWEKYGEAFLPVSIAPPQMLTHEKNDANDPTDQ